MKYRVVNNEIVLILQARKNENLFLAQSDASFEYRGDPADLCIYVMPRRESRRAPNRE